MAKKSVALEAAHDTIKDIYDLVQEAGSTRAEQAEALDKIAVLCVNEIPDLSEDDDEEEDGEDEDEDEDGDS